VNRVWLAAVISASFFFVPSSASAQSGTTSPPTKAFFVLGATSTSILTDCEACDEETARYLHTGSLLVDAGAPINRRIDLGGEFLWVKSQTEGEDRVRVNFVMAAAQFRPWQTKGFFVKGSMGMAFVRNWILSVDGAETGFRSKALAVGLSAGWEVRASRHVGFELIGSQHVAALGDIELSDRTLENVMGNFWSVGGGIVIR